MQNVSNAREDEMLKKENKEKGASLVEYALLVALIAVIAIAGVRVLGQNISNQFSSAASQLEPAAPAN